MSLPAGMFRPESKSGLQPLVKVCPQAGGEVVMVVVVAVAVSSEWIGGCAQK